MADASAHVSRCRVAPAQYITPHCRADSVLHFALSRYGLRTVKGAKQAILIGYYSYNGGSSCGSLITDAHEL